MRLVQRTPEVRERLLVVRFAQHVLQVCALDEHDVVWRVLDRLSEHGELFDELDLFNEVFELRTDSGAEGLEHETEPELVLRVLDLGPSECKRDPNEDPFFVSMAFSMSCLLLEMPIEVEANSLRVECTAQQEA